MCASITGRSSSPTRWPTGAGSTGPTPCSSTPARPGRTPGSSPSTAGYATSTSTASSSTHSWRPGSSSRTGESTTTTTGHTGPIADSAPPSSSKPGSTNNSYNTHSNWTSYRVPLNLVHTEVHDRRCRLPCDGRCASRWKPRSSRPQVPTSRRRLPVSHPIDGGRSGAYSQSAVGCCECDGRSTQNDSADELRTPSRRDAYSAISSPTAQPADQVRPRQNNPDDLRVRSGRPRGDREAAGLSHSRRYVRLPPRPKGRAPRARIGHSACMRVAERRDAFLHEERPTATVTVELHLRPRRSDEAVASGK